MGLLGLHHRRGASRVQNHPLGRGHFVGVCIIQGQLPRRKSPRSSSHEKGPCHPCLGQRLSRCHPPNTPGGCPAFPGQDLGSFKAPTWDGQRSVGSFLAALAGVATLHVQIQHAPHMGRQSGGEPKGDQSIARRWARSGTRGSSQTKAGRNQSRTMAASNCTAFKSGLTATQVMVGCGQREEHLQFCKSTTEHWIVGQRIQVNGAGQQNHAASHCRSHQRSHDPFHRADGCIEKGCCRHARCRNGVRGRCCQQGFFSSRRRNKTNQELEVVDQEGCPVIADVAPSPPETDGEATNPGPRFRRRGPRSQEGEERQRARQQAHQSNVHVSTNQPGETEASWSESKFLILHVNIRGWVSHNAELVATIKIMDRIPDLVCVNGTLLNQAVGDISLQGYTLIARSDRSDGRTRGGIAAFAREKIAERVSMIMESDAAERFWLMVHAEQEPHLIGVW